MDAYLIDDKRKLHVCGNNPNFEGFIVEEGEFKVKGYEGPTVECDKCGSDMVLKMAALVSTWVVPTTLVKYA